MAKTTGRGFSEFVGNFDSPEAAREQLIDEPMRAARGSAIATGLEFFAFMTTIPDAFIAAQRREAARFAQSRGEKDKKVATLNAAVDQAERVRDVATAGQARIQRVIEMMGNRGTAAFQGFVSNPNLAPMAGLTVRIVPRDATSTDVGLSATTGDDGFFRIPLDDERSTVMNLRMVALADTSANVEGMKTMGDIAARVEILDAAGAVIYRDPTPLAISGRGGAYREYVLPQMQGDKRASNPAL